MQSTPHCCCCWNLFLKFFIDFGFGFVCCVRLDCFGSHLFFIAVPCPLVRLINVCGRQMDRTNNTAVCNNKLVWGLEMPNTHTV